MFVTCLEQLPVHGKLWQQVFIICLHVIQIEIM